MGVEVKQKVTAMWSISLNTMCPRCCWEFDAISLPDFWDGRDLDMGEFNTKRSRDVELWCPMCDHEFKADLEY